VIFDLRTILWGVAHDSWKGVKLAAPFIAWMLFWGGLCFGLGAVFALDNFGR
jgi:hypothetical protein